MNLRACHILFAASLLAAPVAAQLTIEIPREHVEGLPDMPDLPVPDINPDLSSLDDLLRSIEEIGRLDWAGTLPEAVAEFVLGASPFDAQVQVVWEMQATRNWTETVSGSGVLNVIDQTVLGNARGRQLHAILDTPARDWPFHLAAFVPDSAPPIASIVFTGPGDGDSDGGTGFSQLSNHMFESDRILGFSSPGGMQAGSFDGTVDADFSGRFLYTQVDGGRIRVNSSGNGYRIGFWARVREFDSASRAPTGRTAELRGWICEAAAFEADPDYCIYDDFQLVDHTPPSERVNVNPEHPAVTVTFSDPVNIPSLAAGFSLFTAGADGERIEVAGEWRHAPYPGAWREDAAQRLALIAPEPSQTTCSDRNRFGLATHDWPSLAPYADPQEYGFHPTTPLRPGTIYEARVAGGQNGVRALNGDEYLAEDHVWRFSTLLQLDEQSPDRVDGPLHLRVFQTVRDPALITDKPVLTRLYPDWSPHGDIAPDWQPERFDFELALSEPHPHGIGQRGVSMRANRRAWIEPQSAFGEDDWVQAHQSVNFFGWLPQAGGPDMLEIVACPYAPFPHALEAAEIRHEHPIRIWDHDPGDLNFYYVIAEIGAWAAEWEQIDAVLMELERDLAGLVMLEARGLARQTVTTFRGVLDDLWQGQIEARDVGRRLADDLSESLGGYLDPDGDLDRVITSASDRLRRLLEQLNEIEGGISEADRRRITQTLLLAQEYAPQFLPYRSANAHATGITFGGLDLILASLVDPRAAVRSMAGDVGGPWQGDRELGRRIRIANYIRMLQRMALDHVGPDDFIVVVLPDGFLVDGKVGLAITELESHLYKGFFDYRTRAVVMAIQYDEILDADMIATGLVHEFGHALSLPHLPGIATPTWRRDPGITGFRLAPSGLHGWNKSYVEGNAEDPEILRSLMWPNLQPSGSVWMSEGEYEQVQRAIEAGFGQRAALFERPPIRTAQATAENRTDASDPPGEWLIVTGLIGPDGAGVVVDPLRLRSAPPSSDHGDYRAELLDAEGYVLRSIAFDPMPRHLDRAQALLLGGQGPDNPLLWPEFRLALDPHPGAAALRISEGSRELALMAPPGSPPRLVVEADEPIRIGRDDQTIRWSASADGPVHFDVEYSATGAAPWMPLAVNRRQAEITVSAEDLMPGPRPHLRITAQSGLHATRELVPVRLQSAPLPVSVDLPDPVGALQGVPPTLRFATDISPEALDAHLSLVDPTGAPVEMKVLHLGALRMVSLLPMEPMAPNTTYSVRLDEGLSDRFGNRLEQSVTWDFRTAGP
ncbi:MAG: Ig-like domain-containing protein [Rubellimicrobium sp.]|nr:Ig-like domain-containing protein [Rubellimicrobium sp.]